MFAPPTIERFLIVLLVAPAVKPSEVRVIVEEPLTVLRLLTVRPFPPVFKPSIVTRSAPLSLISAPVMVPETVRVAPPPGWIVSV